MVIGVCTIELVINDSNSLKDKRQVMKSLIARIGNRFNVSVSEIECQDIWRRGTIGVACICTDQQIAGKMLNKVIELVDSEPRVVVADCRVEML
ncbi:MAG: hypothetical protein AUJ92_11580 [Armatimonadetes bacterium CG2_30_59_28]|nr:DUF503 domain-containing protein [Armatimonadota bacterium]OIO93790.1 MAG: hypothetical protein AUJ92_11580 [Armatimonadetes bacterium CG2_30_59_28]PIU62144.1 MAG: DUF503 domain-containing protein [Armatimonadetes bacterium CG07_land_8_20_14_0_80_59_28]PIX45810.1 MAG: DUF503 domain-containing protein [Armatimonadetes bacterium CG_4_8_14_3_um_filter_58_9]PIY44985.1 MAG: DUF503 domain-containing protein [Armatimonadetes bacterium CG_4_10_14_3_um_filter_59_10]PJB65418.1 MAG: DUF503 domain-cont